MTVFSMRKMVLVVLAEACIHRSMLRLHLLMLLGYHLFEKQVLHLVLCLLSCALPSRLSE